MMYAYANPKKSPPACRATAAQVLITLLWSAALPLLAGAFLVGGLAALSGLPPLDLALDFLGRAFIALSGPATNLGLSLFFAAALYYGVSPRLPGQLWHRPLTAYIVARFTLLCALWTAQQAGVISFAANRTSLLAALTRPSRVALSTAADLAGSAPRLE